MNESASNAESEIQSMLLDFEEYDDKDKIKNIYANHVKKILSTLKKQRKIHENASILFHNDSDGFCAALYTKQVLRDLKFIIEPEDFLPLTHLERDKLKLDENKIYFFLDIQPPMVAENIFCIDHHQIDNRKRYISHNMIIFSPDDIETGFITTATFLSMYFYYVHKDYRFNFSRFVEERPWWRNDFDRFVAIFSAVADNLWLLSKYSPVRKLKDCIDELEFKERKFIKVSMGISLLLGRDYDRLQGFNGILESPLNLLNLTLFDRVVDPRSNEIDNLYRFARSVDREAKLFVTEQNEIIDNLLYLAGRELERDKKTISDYIKAMPISLKKDIDTSMEMLKTIGNTDKSKWKQIEFYGRELERLHTHMKSLEKKILMLGEKKVMINPDKVPGICVFISKQSSEQVKGILSSLLYYFGQKNIVVEETQAHAVWGARGFVKEQLEEVLMTLIFDKKMLDSYLRLEDMSKDLPTSYRRSLNISHHITMDSKYVGGMGGRGLAFGGNIKGRVPQLFAFLDVSDLEHKIKELISHGELSQAIKGMTEGHTVSTVNALRTKFKSLGWVTVQVIGGSGSGDILAGEYGHPIAWLAGSHTDINLSDIGKPEK